MFKTKKTIISISRGKLRAGNVAVRPPVKIDGLIEVDWTPETLDQVLTQVKKALKAKTVRVVVGEDLSYVVSVSIPKDPPASGQDETSEREAVKQKLQELVPENLDEAVWDFREVAETHESKVVQVVAIVKTFFENLSLGLQKANLAVEAIEPTSYALARLTENEKQPHLIVHNGQTATALVADHGLVVASEMFGAQITMVKIGQLLDFAQEHFNITPGKIILSGNMEGVDAKQLEAKDREIEQKDLDPMIGLAFKKDLKGKDENVLNLEPLKVTREFAEKLSERSKKMEDNNQLEPQPSSQIQVEGKKPQFESSNGVSEKRVEPQQKSPPVFLRSGEEEKPPFVKKTLFVVFLIVVVLGAIVAGGILAYRKAFKKEKETQKPTTEVVSPSPSSSPSATPASEEKLNRKDLKIKVLNGNGIKGSAGKLASLLEELGYQKIETGNADSYDYEKTVIKIKESKKEYLELITEDLGDNYSTEGIQANFDENNEFDVILIVGKE